MNQEYLTVEDVATLLHVHRNTVYRWCREGRIPALRFGKSWRIPRAALEHGVQNNPAAGETEPLEEGWPTAPLVRDMCHSGDHVLAITQSPQAVYDLEAQFLSEGLSLNVRLFKACWWQHPDDARSELALRGLEVDHLERRQRLVIADLKGVYDREGPTAAASLWVNETLRARQDGFERLWGCGSPYLTDTPEMHARLCTFEALLSSRLKGLPVIGLCSYFLNQQVPDYLAKLANLMRNHEAVLTYGGPNDIAFARLQAE